MAVDSSVHQHEYSPNGITSHGFWSQTFDERDRTFATLRALDGLSWHAPLPSLFDLEESGFWALTRRADIAYVSMHPALFTSAQGRRSGPDACRGAAIRLFLSDDGRSTRFTGG